MHVLSHCKCLYAICLFVYCLIAPARYSSSEESASLMNGYPCWFELFTTKYHVSYWLFTDGLYSLKKSHFFSICWVCTKLFLYLLKRLCIYFSLSVNNSEDIDLFYNAKPTSLSFDNSYLIIVYYHFYILSEIIFKYFVKGFVSVN